MYSVVKGNVVMLILLTSFQVSVSYLIIYSLYL